MRQILMECFHFSEQRFPRICLNKVPIISVHYFSLSITDYRRISFQRFTHFYHSRIQQFETGATILFMYDFSRRRPVFMLSLWWFFIIIYWPTWMFCTLQTPRWLFGINLYLLLYKVLFKSGPVWNATLP